MQPRPRWPIDKCYVKPFHMEPHTRMWFLNQCIEIHVLGMAKKKKHLPTLVQTSQHDWSPFPGMGNGDWEVVGVSMRRRRKGRRRLQTPTTFIPQARRSSDGATPVYPLFYFEKVDFPKSDSYSKWVFPIRSCSHMFDTENPKQWAAKAIQSDMLNCSISFEDGSTMVSAWKSPNYVTKKISTNMVK